jgi:cell division protein FtsA
MARKPVTLAAIDLGTHRCCTVITEIAGPERLEVVGIGSRRTNGIRRGVIVNLEALVTSIGEAIEQAQEMATTKIDALIATVPAAQVRSFTARGVVSITNRDRVVGHRDLDRVLETVRAVQIPSGQSTLHALPQEYTLDGQEGIQDPVGMTGSRLEGSFHVVTVPRQAAQHVVNALNVAKLDVASLVFPLLASAEAVLTEEEKDQGVFLIDVGGGTTDVALFERGALWYTGSIPIAGDLVTNDISIGLRTPTHDAESIKRTHARATAGAEDDIAIEVPPLGGGTPPRLVTQSLLTQIVGPRVEEIFELVRMKLEQANLLNRARVGAVLVGGSANLDGMLEVAEEILGMPARIGTPRGIGGLTEDVKGPSFATPVGLALWEMRRGRREREREKRETTAAGPLLGGFMTRIGRAREWLGGMF